MGREKINTGLILTVMLIMCLVISFPAETQAKTSTVTIDLTGGSEPVKRPAKLKNAKKVKITNSKKSVVKVKYLKSNKDKRIQFTGKKVGTARVSVKCFLKDGKTKTYKYNVKVKRSKEKTDLDYAKEAFKIQNDYRVEKGVAALEWSDELYEFCLYRLKTSGFDRHENLVRDMNDYFGGFAEYNDILFGENLYSGSGLPKNAMSAWKESTVHYNNLMNEEHRCGAVARYGIMWCAVFYDGDKDDFSGWDQKIYKKVNVRRFDNASGSYFDGCQFVYYDTTDRDNTKVKRIKDASGKEIFLEAGKTYVIYEQSSPPGCTKAEKITVTADDMLPDEIILK